MNKLKSFLAHIEELDKQATPGSWECNRYPQVGAQNGAELRTVESVQHTEKLCGPAYLGVIYQYEDAEFIAESRDLLPRLARAIRAVHEYAKGMETMVGAKTDNISAFGIEILHILEHELVGGHDEQG